MKNSEDQTRSTTPVAAAVSTTIYEAKRADPAEAAATPLTATSKVPTQVYSQGHIDN